MASVPLVFSPSLLLPQLGSTLFCSQPFKQYRELTAMPKEIFILRHGQTEFNAAGKLQGHCNSPLTELGRAQAKAYGVALQQQLRQSAGNPEQEFQLVSSPLGRAMETAALVAEVLCRDPGAIIAEPRVIECGLGEWEQTRVADIHAARPELAGRNDWYLQGPGAETLPQVQQRLAHWLTDPATPERVILVSHGLTGIVLRALLLGLDNKALWRQDKPQDALYHFHSEAQERLKRICC
ncbi:histidine phosphatase family protein [Shewanella algae]